jgi:exoribonuclease R
MSEKQRLVGVLHTDSKVKYGMEKGKMIYLFESHAISPLKEPGLTSLHVPSKLMHQTTKKYVSVEWDGISSRGVVLDYLGDVGDLEAEYLYLRYLCGLHSIKPLKALPICSSEIEIQDLTQYRVYSIDPPGCRDIDDAFHYDGETHQIGIHIAYPWSLFDEERRSEIICLFLQRVSTLYMPHGNIPMMYKGISEDLASLLEKKKRRAITILYQLDEEERMILRSEIQVGSVVQTVKNYDYETVDAILQKAEAEGETGSGSGKERMLRRWHAVSERIFQKRLDAHTVVESWMLYTNQTVATELVQRHGRRVLLRTMSGGKTPSQASASAPLELQNFLQMVRSEGAEYRLYDPEREDEMCHRLLGSTTYYTHFTSPIRRFCDMYNQALLAGTLPEGFQLEASAIDEINRVTRAMRKYQRLCDWTTFLFTSEKSVYTLYAYLYEIDPARRLVRLYVTGEEEGKCRGMVLKKYVVQKRFEEITEVEWDEEVKRLTIKDENGRREYVLYEKRRIRVYLYPNRHRMQDRMEIFFCD